MKGKRAVIGTSTMSGGTHAAATSSDPATGSIPEPAPIVNARSAGHEARAVAIAAGVTISAVVAALLAMVLMIAAQRRLTPNPEAEQLAFLNQTVGPAGEPLDFVAYASGKTLFASTCVSCHGTDGRGVLGTGKDLTRSQFVRTTGDDALLEFLKRGRDPSDPLNTTKVQMPPKGGNPALDEEQLLDIIEFVRGLQDPRRIPSAPAPKTTGRADGLGGRLIPS